MDLSDCKMGWLDCSLVTSENMKVMLVNSLDLLVNNLVMLDCS